MRAKCAYSHADTEFRQPFQRRSRFPFAAEQHGLLIADFHYIAKRQHGAHLFRRGFLTVPQRGAVIRVIGNQRACFLCGPDILACPVFNEGATQMTVTLPDLGSGWRLRGRGPLYPAGETLTLPCLPTDDPLWFVRSR